MALRELNNELACIVKKLQKEGYQWLAVVFRELKSITYKGVAEAEKKGANLNYVKAYSNQWNVTLLYNCSTSSLG